MKNLIFPAVALLALGFAFASADTAEARGFHFQRGGVHLDVGYPTSYSNSYWGGGFGHSHWQNTTHLDYHPGGYVPHGNHLDYQPGHYDVHRSGHFDHHPW